MNFSETQINTLRKIFDEQAQPGQSSINEEGLRKLLIDLDIDESFAPPMLRIISGSNNNGKIEFDQFLTFFQILLSQNIKQFFELLFNAIDGNSDGKLLAGDIVEFGKLIGDEITSEEADQIIMQCDLDKSGSIEFNDFWKWFSEER
ncbi:EF-hand family [Trichomonas vaginalis G3]|uniref:EF-hand family n=1 Tax=Trichomonas vaginalis (strain ATCC PRA-98 / G3) TaxID=412133 RepID=UPI0021E54BD7|nr:EF-hand family [Trichomonas vaginalis G3]KAI5530892.1 EF-hand family [Trichomonas vaginalis G3]